jgi:hypothetical protein
MAVAVVLIGVASVISPSVAAQQGPLTGKELADSLSLTLLDEKPSDCMDFVEVEDPAGYCIEDAVVPGGRESYELGQLLRGYVPSELDLDIFALQAQIAETASDDATVVELYQELQRLLAERDSSTTDSSAIEGATVVRRR